MLVKRNKILPYVNSNIEHLLCDDEYDVFELQAMDLISPSRLDIVVKYLYAKAYVHKELSTFLIDMYAEHIKAFNGFVEADDTNKVGKDAFISNFNNIINSILQEGYNSNYLIPITNNNIPLDGAHRISILSVLNKTSNCIKIENLKSNIFNYKFFINRDLDSLFVDYASIQYAKIKGNCYMVMVWPIAIGHDSEIVDILNLNGQIVNEKNIKISYNGLLNLQKIEYKNENWLGCYSNNFEGAQTKCSQCFSKDGVLRAYLFESTSDMIKMKDQIRDIFNIGKHAIHINDTQEETIEISNLIFNENALHFLNCSTQKEMKNFNKLFAEFIKYIEDNKIDKNKVAIIGGVLALYGIRDAEDLDYISLTDKIPNKISEEIELETKKLKYTKLSTDEIITNPKYHFIYKGFKFVCLNVILEIKEARNNDSDKRDVVILKKLINEGYVKYTFKDRLREFFSISFYRRKLKLFLLKIRYILYSILKKKK